MIELLVALVIFSFGMLGIAGLQTRTLSYSQNSLLRSYASNLTDDILDRMRADRANAVASPSLWATTVTDVSSGMPASPTTIYGKEIKEWKQAVEASLPNGRASIAVSTGTVTIIIRWNEREAEGQEAQTSTFQTISQL
jgi:type IV pilus assembly protein PilV